MSADFQDSGSRLTAQAEELIGALAHAEKTILATIERECEALRARRMLAANSLHNRLQETTKIYLSCARAARANIETMERVLPGCRDYLDQRRAAFAPTLQIQLAVLGAQRAAAEAAVAERAYAESRLSGSPNPQPAVARPKPGRLDLHDARPTIGGTRAGPQLPPSPSAPNRRAG
jgi:hypothetical protein